MTTLKNPMEIFKLLPRTDCRDCGAATCLAFFFFDLLSFFSGREIESGISADRAVLLHLLPKVPMVVAYSFAEDDFESSLRLLFDPRVEENLNAEALRNLTGGVARMVRRLVRRHGLSESFMKHVNR